jgi:thiamine biosynthesis lipoprotein
MKQTRILMGMPITVEIVDTSASDAIFNDVYDYFTHVDEVFSTYKTTSEISAINKNGKPRNEWSEEMNMIFLLAEETKQATNGYFDIKKPDGSYDPSGIVKGWAIANAAHLLEKKGFENFYVEAGGDIQPHGHNHEGKKWSIGIRNPWNAGENVKAVYVTNEGVATSGTYIRGEHIYNPKTGAAANEITSLTVIGSNIYDADRFATAAFAMGKDAIRFIEALGGFEGYVIDNNKIATMTSGFEKYYENAN